MPAIPFVTKRLKGTGKDWQRDMAGSWSFAEPSATVAPQSALMNNNDIKIGKCTTMVEMVTEVARSAMRYLYPAHFSLVVRTVMHGTMMRP